MFRYLQTKKEAALVDALKRLQADTAPELNALLDRAFKEEL